MTFKQKLIESKDIFLFNLKYIPNLNVYLIKKN